MSSTETLVTLSKIEYLTRERDEMLNKITELLDERDELRADNESLRRAAGALDELTSKLRQELTETESALAACDAQCERLRADAKDHEAREQLMFEVARRLFGEDEAKRWLTVVFEAYADLGHPKCR